MLNFKQLETKICRGAGSRDHLTSPRANFSKIIQGVCLVILVLLMSFQGIQPVRDSNMGVNSSAIVQDRVSIKQFTSYYGYFSYLDNFYTYNPHTYFENGGLIFSDNELAGDLYSSTCTEFVIEDFAGLMESMNDTQILQAEEVFVSNDSDITDFSVGEYYFTEVDGSNHLQLNDTKHFVANDSLRYYGLGTFTGGGQWSVTGTGSYRVDINAEYADHKKIIVANDFGDGHSTRFQFTPYSVETTGLISFWYLCKNTYTGDAYFDLYDDSSVCMYRLLDYQENLYFYNWSDSSWDVLGAIENNQWHYIEIDLDLTECSVSINESVKTSTYDFNPAASNNFKRIDWYNSIANTGGDLMVDAVDFEWSENLNPVNDWEGTGWVLDQNQKCMNGYWYYNLTETDTSDYTVINSFTQTGTNTSLIEEFYTNGSVIDWETLSTPVNVTNASIAMYLTNIDGVLSPVLEQLEISMSNYLYNTDASYIDPANILQFAMFSFVWFMNVAEYIVSRVAFLNSSHISVEYMITAAFWFYDDVDEWVNVTNNEIIDMSDYDFDLYPHLMVEHIYRERNGLGDTIEMGIQCLELLGFNDNYETTIIFNKTLDGEGCFDDWEVDGSFDYESTREDPVGSGTVADCQSNWIQVDASSYGFLHYYDDDDTTDPVYSALYFQPEELCTNETYMSDLGGGNYGFNSVNSTWINYTDIRFSDIQVEYEEALDAELHENLQRKNHYFTVMGAVGDPSNDDPPGDSEDPEPHIPPWDDGFLWWFFGELAPYVNFSLYYRTPTISMNYYTWYYWSSFTYIPALRNIPASIPVPIIVWMVDDQLNEVAFSPFTVYHHLVWLEYRLVPFYAPYFMFYPPAITFWWELPFYIVCMALYYILDCLIIMLEFALYLLIIGISIVMIPMNWLFIVFWNFAGTAIAFAGVWLLSAFFSGLMLIVEMSAFVAAHVITFGIWVFSGFRADYWQLFTIVYTGIWYGLKTFSYVINYLIANVHFFGMIVPVYLLLLFCIYLRRFIRNRDWINADTQTSLDLMWQYYSAPIRLMYKALRYAKDMISGWF